MKPEVIHPEARQPLFLICDHASNHIPPAFGDLGLGEDALQDHIAWDIGAAGVTRKIAGMMKVPAVLASVSRLVLDTNRDADDMSRIPLMVDGHRIAGNNGLEDGDRKERHNQFYLPFHDTADTLLDQQLAAGLRPLVVAIHSFSPVYEGFQRPWQIGIMWNRDTRLAQALIGLVERETDLVIGENEPWSGKDLFHTLQRHGADRGLLHAGIEIRNDLIRTEPQQTAMAALLADILDECMERDDLG